MKIAGFVISLERAVERREHADWIVANVPVSCSRLNAVDGSALSSEHVDRIYQRQIYTPRYPHVLKRGEIGCFLSHRVAWQAIVDQKIDMALILEDDVVFDTDELAAAIGFISKAAADIDYVQLQVRDVASTERIVAQCDGLTLRSPRHVPLRTTAQMVSFRAADRLLKTTETFDRPVDVFLQMTWLTGVPIKVLAPCVIREISQQIGGSTLGGARRPWYENVRREILRSVYRAKIRSQARRAA
jgi:glycosyl transferase family 25